MSIYQKVLGDDFDRLHPMLQKRYQLQEGTPFVAQGVMHEIKGGPKWLLPFFYLGVYFKLLFPERGVDIPFTIKNTAYRSNQGESAVYWERIFYFDKKKRYFNARMSVDEDRGMVKDYLGEPSPLYSDLHFTVTNDGGLEITSLKQRLVLGKVEIPLPKFLQGLAQVRETYVEADEVYQISVHVHNPLIGRVFSYEGVFSYGE